MAYLLLIVGFLLIIVASEILVESAKSIAIKLKVPKILIALTVVAFGTCAPELAISFNSIIDNNGSIALANVVGSCIVNILLVIGLASVINPIKIKNLTIKKELPLLVLVTWIFTLVISNAMLSKDKLSTLNMIDGLILLLLFSLFIIYIVRLVKNKDSQTTSNIPKYSIIKAIIYLIITIIVITYSADLLVANAVIIANSLGISQKIITMIAIVIGTSLPELFLTVTAARKNEHEMAIGNIIGTNIFNICVVLGLPIFLFNGFEIIDFNLIDISVVFLAAILLFIFARNDQTLTKKEGFLMLFICFAYYIYIII